MAQRTEVHPVWKDDLSMDYERESQQMFMRRKLSGSLDFIREDYDLIMGFAFGTVYSLTIEISDGGASWSEYWRGRFTLTDCKIDADNKRITVKPEVDDQYREILDGLDKEFDLIKLAPVIEKIRLSKRPCIQILNMASESVTVLCGNLSFEQDISLPSADQAGFLEHHCHFFPISRPVEIRITNPPFGYETALGDPFEGIINGDGSRLTNEPNQFYIEYYEEVILGVYVNGLRIRNTAQDIVYWEWSNRAPSAYEPLPTAITFEAQQTTLTDIDAVTTDLGLYSRIVCNVDEYNGVPTLPLYSDDAVPYNRNYKRAISYDASGMIVSSSRTTLTPTEWGRLENSDYYYLPPDDVNQYLPIGRYLWGDTSVWIQKTNDYMTIEQGATYEFILNDAYPLWSVISVLLNEVAPGITFAGTAAYSDFLYSGHDEIQVRDNRLYITPKSNITNGEYQTPAQKAPVTLKDILSMLRNTYQCYWFIDEQNRLRIEHVRFFIYGGSYSSLHPSVGINLNTMQNVRNGKPWAYRTNSYEYEKIDMPERYQFAWMDEVTDAFKGQPIVMLSSFVEQGKVEEINVANFTSDIDYMQLNPSAISPDGFALMNVSTDGDGTLYVPIITFYAVGYSWRAQNGWLSFHSLQFAYWVDNMPSRRIQIEGDTITAATVQKGRKQQVNIPLGIADPNVMQLVATGLGNGQIRQMSIRLTSRMAKTQLRYDTE